MTAALREALAPISVDVGDVFPDYAGVWAIRPWETGEENELIEVKAAMRLQKHGVVSLDLLPYAVRNNGGTIAALQVLATIAPPWFATINMAPAKPELFRALRLVYSRYEAARDAVGEKNPAPGG